MRVYLAAPYGAREEVLGLASDLYSRGMTCSSSWLAETHEINPGTEGAAPALSDAQVALHATDDLVDILSSQALVLFTAAYLGVEGGGGRHIETGYAMATGIPVIVVGEPENVFHRMGLPRVELVSDWASALGSLALRQP